MIAVLHLLLLGSFPTSRALILLLKRGILKGPLTVVKLMKLYGMSLITIGTNLPLKAKLFMLNFLVSRSLNLMIMMILMNRPRGKRLFVFLR
jgi:hypothetical protein